MKKLLVACLFTISSAAFAQDSARAVNLKAKGIATYDQAWAKMDQVLKLTPSQEVQWQALNKSYAPQYKTVLTNTTLSKTDKETQLSALHTQQEAELGKILTPVQTAEWNGIKKSVKTTVQTKAQTIKAVQHVPKATARVRS